MTRTRILAWTTLFPLAAVLLAPASAHAWGIVVPHPLEDAQTPACIEVWDKQAELAIGTDDAQGIIRTQFGLSQDRTVSILVPDLAGAGAPTLILDGDTLDIRKLELRAADSYILELARDRQTPALVAATGHDLHYVELDLSAGSHQLEVQMAVPIDRSSQPLQAVLPLRDLDTHCWNTGAQVQVDVQLDRPIGAVLTPYHERELTRPTPQQVQLNVWNTSGQACHDFWLYLGGDGAGDTVASDLISYRAPSCDPVAADSTQGFMMLAAAPTVTEPLRAVAKDVTFVIDISGSMLGEKIQQVRRALSLILGQLSRDDRFELVRFSSEARGLFEELRDADDDDAMEEARRMVENLEAGGSTNINDALLLALRGLADAPADRPQIIVFLTDGAATAGITDNNAILANVEAENAELGAQIHTFGVGYGVNTFLLDELARRSNARPNYITPGVDIEAVLADFYAQIQAPILTDLGVSASGVTVSELYPEALPDLFLGGELQLLARYSDGVEAAVALTGRDELGERAVPASGDLLRTGTAHAFLPRLWASRELGQLLYEARQNGGEESIVAEIRRLALRHGFVTRFTPFAADNEGNLDRGYSNPTGDQSGSDAVHTSAYIDELSNNSNAGAYGAAPGQAPIVQVLDRTFVLHDGYWMDTRVPAQLEELTDFEIPEDAEIIDVDYMGAGWEALRESVPVMRELFAVSRQLIVEHHCQVIRVNDPAIEERPEESFVPPGLLTPDPRHLPENIEPSEDFADVEPVRPGRDGVRGENRTGERSRNGRGGGLTCASAGADFDLSIALMLGLCLAFARRRRVLR